MKMSLLKLAPFLLLVVLCGKVEIYSATLRTPFRFGVLVEGVAGVSGTQIPFGNDNKKDKGNNNDKSQYRGPSPSALLRVRMTDLWWCGRRAQQTQRLVCG